MDKYLYHKPEKVPILKRLTQKDSLQSIGLYQGDDETLVGVFSKGEGTYSDNTQYMKWKYFHSKENSNFSFRPATTGESIDFIANSSSQEGNSWKARIDDTDYDNAMKNKKKDDIIMHLFPSLQLGRVDLAREGVYINSGHSGYHSGMEGYIPETRFEKELEEQMKDSKEINGIYFSKNSKMVFVPYETFKDGEMDAEEFSHSGLARGLEETTESSARNFKRIASLRDFPGGVAVSYRIIPQLNYLFSRFNKRSTIPRVAILQHLKENNKSKLLVSVHPESNPIDNFHPGYAFGIAVQNKAQKVNV